MKLASDSAQTVLERAAGGDQAAFAALVRQYQRMVYSLALHSLRNPDTAADLAQEVFLQLYRSLKSIESPEHLVQWLRKVASHRSIDQARRNRYRPKVGLDEAPEPRTAPADSDPLLSAVLDRLIASLPARSRMIVILRYQEDLDPTEIARALDIPIGTVKSNLHRSLALLRGRLERAQTTIPSPRKGVIQ